MSMFRPEDELDHIAEFADSGVRRFQRQGSLVGVPGSYGLKRWLYQRWGNRGNAVYTFIGSLVIIGLSGTWAWAVREPLIFPSLGATAFLIFETPMAEIGSPRNTIIGHGVGVVAGAFALAVTGLLSAPSVYASGVTPARIGAIALAVALTGGLLRVLRSAHPPAGATTIIVASGLLAKPVQMLDVIVGVLLLTAAGLGVNRALGVPAPRWSASDAHSVRREVTRYVKRRRKRSDEASRKPG
ncbi:MAG: HPP family protein [Solirubrobacteraceae bacterium]